MIVPAHAGIYKFNVDVVADTLKIPVVPHLEWERRCLTTALFLRSVVASAARMCVNTVRLAICNVNMAAVRLPSWLAGCKVLVGIRDAGVVFFAKLIVWRIRIRIAAQPELLDKLVPLLIVA